jgi:hypothetical protein
MSRLTETTLNLTRGDTGKWDVVLTDPADDSALVLTGCTLRLAVWAETPAATVANDTDAELVLTSTPAAGIVITDAAAGEMTITISKTQSAALTGELYRFDLQLINASAESYTAARGLIWVEAQHTHDS